MENNKTIEVLNSLITINNERIEGYETASKESKEQDLKSLFTDFTSTSQKCKQELVIEVTKLGGKIAEGTMISGKFFRVWMDVKAALTGNDRKAILDSCEYGEDTAVNAYNEVLKNNLNDITTEQQSMIRAQYHLIVADHNKVKSLRDALVSA
ncbi:MAG: PA2169 family four-helix-bundle protein [Bacteroidetes bacterium]|nr:PA2169 family four-helix-bundle protein [Bacteroidota bacterium]MBK8328340.1 PA2169 family four-helix-bundle protein [Bacteroidota bacterium]MBK9482819.1 PA2169 family four-helix-bundle protein [Bacteroidota bacterium]HQW46470.1 PA2169 family four-helix-bundle protein [Chitinophagaceae bacterium]